MATYDLTQPLRDIKGRIIMMPSDDAEPVEGSNPARFRKEDMVQKPLGDIVCDVLMHDLKDVEPSKADKLRRSALATMVAVADGPVELNPNQVSIIDERCAKMASTLAYAQIAEVLGTIEE